LEFLIPGAERSDILRLSVCVFSRLIPGIGQSRSRKPALFSSNMGVMEQKRIIGKGKDQFRGSHCGNEISLMQADQILI
jgi:hypothetical protein